MILDKYKEYDIHISIINNILTINKSIPVKVFVTLKEELKEKGLIFNNIIVNR